MGGLLKGKPVRPSETQACLQARRVVVNKFMLAAFLLPFTLSACGKSRANTDDAAKVHARQAAMLFFNACVATGANEAKLAALAAKEKMLELNSEQKQPFHFEPEAKRVWGVHSEAGGRFFLVSGKSYCSVKAKQADAEEIEAEMAEMAAKVAENLNLAHRIMNEEQLSPTIRQVVHTIAEQNGQKGISFLVYTNTDAKAGAQAALNFHYFNDAGTQGRLKP